MSRSRPVIGITADVKATEGDPRTAYDLRVKGNYAQAVADAGGIPILIPPEAAASEIMEVIDGLLIPGGDDIDSVHFGQDLHPEALLQNPMRFDAESELYRAAPIDLPILGICYGCQFINVMQGGTLIQHLPDIAGAMTHTGGELQTYELEPGTQVAKAIGATRVEGKSYHHQAVEAPGADVRVAGHAADGTVEAIEVTSRDWTIAVQWHPERTLDDERMQSLFRALISEATEYRAKRLSPRVGV